MLEVLAVVATPAAKPPPPAPAPAVAPARGGSGKSIGVYIGIGLLVVVLAAVAIAWEMFRARMEELQQGQGGEERLGVLGVSGGTRRDGKSREVKTGEEPAPVAPVDDELTGLGKKKKPPPPKPLNLSPSEKAWRGLKNNYDKLESRNDTTAKKYRIRLNVLADKKDTAPEAVYVREAGALEEELRQELTKPENQ